MSAGPPAPAPPNPQQAGPQPQYFSSAEAGPGIQHPYAAPMNTINQPFQAALNPANHHFMNQMPPFQVAPMIHPQMNANHQYMAPAPMQMQGPVYHHYPAPQRPTPGRRGRPPGSKNKKKPAPAEDDEENYEPPAAKRSAQVECEELPVPHFYDFEVKIGDEASACSRCDCNIAMFLMLPCHDYGLCGDCLHSYKKQFKENNVPETCIFCHRKVESYFRYYRGQE